MQIQHIIKNNIGKGVVIVSLGWLVQPVVHAQSELELLNAVRACQTVGELSARLACYDRVLPPTSGSVRMNPPGLRVMFRRPEALHLHLSHVKQSLKRLLPNSSNR
ncbi:MAG: hypothetical protein ACJ0BT_01180 [Pseudohongiellaceae bacterium]